MSPTVDRDVLIVGGGPAGLAAATFTARAGLETQVVDAGESILRRNAHLENYPGFPAGVNSRLLLDMMADQAERAGSLHTEGRIETLETSGEQFLATAADDREFVAKFVIVATKNAVDFLGALDGVEIVSRGKDFVETDERGRTGVDGLYAAGRLAMQPYQTIVVTGHGAAVGLAVIQDSSVDFYHDWVAPEGYFTGRGRDVPPGCEEIPAADRAERERESMAVMQEYFAEAHPAEPTQHPSVAEED
jgi:thioredoxin reductase (NADPH)